MKNILIAFFLLLSFTGFSQYVTKDTTFGGYVARISYWGPTAGDSCNLFLNMNGAGEVGTVNKTALYGPHYWFANGWDGSVTLANGVHHPTYVTLQQSITAFDPPTVLKPKVDAIIARFKVKFGGLHMMGLSRGAWCWNHFIAYKATAGDFTYPNMVRSVTNFAGQWPDDTYGAATLPTPQKFGHAFVNVPHLKYWGVEQYQDGSRQVNRIVDNIQDSIGTGTGRVAFFWTNFGLGGHTNFNDMYSPYQTNWTLTNPDVQLSNGGYINTIPIATGQNVWQWLLRQSADTSLIVGGGGPPPNVSPTVSTGSDQTITLPTAMLTLLSTSGDADGTIVTYAWTQISGTAATITTPSASSTTITGLTTTGTRVFQLRVTDNNGATATDQVSVTVNPTVTNVPPTVGAGTDQTITLPTSSVSVTATPVDTDGTITSIQWIQRKGPYTNTTFGTPTAATTTLGNLIEGKYTFRVTVTDNTGATAYDEVQITVNRTTAPCNALSPVSYTIAQTSPGEIYITNAASKPWKGGDTLKIPAGTYTGGIEISNFHGDACRPIVIINQGLVVTPFFRIKNTASYFKLTGSGTSTIQYGFKVKVLAISIARQFEIDRIESDSNTNGVGFYAKSDVDTLNPNTLEGNFTMDKLKFHDSWIHGSLGEGMYIGSTDPSGGGSGGITGVPPIRLDSVEIYNMRVENTGWDGIQLSNARYGAKIYNNHVRTTGTRGVSDQIAGIILGGNTNGDVYGNTIIKSGGNGIQSFGIGAIKVYNNTLDSCGTAAKQSMYFRDVTTAPESNPPQALEIYNNHINHPYPGTIPAGGNGVYVEDNGDATATNLHDNFFCIPGADGSWQTKYIRLDVSGSSNTNNILQCASDPAPPAGCNCFTSMNIYLNRPRP